MKGCCGLGFLVILCTGAFAGNEHCDRYSYYKNLPGRFREVASGELSGPPSHEFFVLSDGLCTCDSEINFSHKKDTPIRRKLWTCRKADKDDT
jgi:hypothetical protein